MAKKKKETKKLPTLTRDETNALYSAMSLHLDELDHLDSWVQSDRTLASLVKKGYAKQLKAQKGRFFSLTKEAKHMVIDARIARLCSCHGFCESVEPERL